MVSSALYDIKRLVMEQKVDRGKFINIKFYFASFRRSLSIIFSFLTPGEFHSQLVVPVCAWNVVKTKWTNRMYWKS